MRPFGEVIAQSAFIRGPHVEKFEKAWAETLGVKHCVSCANGTDALYIAMRAPGRKTGRRNNYDGPFLDINLRNNYSGWRPGGLLRYRYTIPSRSIRR